MHSHIEAEKDTCKSLGIDHGRLLGIAGAVTADIEAEKCDGVALKISRRGTPVLDARIGFADRAANQPLDDSTVFYSMSIGKQFINVLAMSFVDRGLLRLSAPVAEVIPEFGCRGKEEINLLHLLTHTSGMMPDLPAGNLFQLPPDAMTDNSKLVEWLSQQRVWHKPGEHVSYMAAFGQAVMAEMLTRVHPDKLSLKELLQQELFTPLGMSDTSLGVRDDLMPRLAPIAVRYTHGDLFDPSEAPFATTAIQAGAELPAGGYLTTIADMHRFSEMLCGDGELDGVRIVSPAILDLAAQNHTGDRPNGLMSSMLGQYRYQEWPANIGLGFFVKGDGITPGPVGNLLSRKTLVGIGAGTTFLTVDRERDVSVSFMSTGFLPDSKHIMRCATISDMAIGALTDI
jgi:CubicO group peptidase (beta-lactamase class C family)